MPASPPLMPAGRDPALTLRLPSHMSSLASSVMQAEGRPVLPSRLMPSDEERTSIESRMSALETDLEPASPDQIIKAVAMLFNAAAQAPVSEETMRGRYRVFMEALSDLPGWAIHAAALKWIRGEVKGEVRFAPSSGDLRRLAEAETMPHRVLIAKLRRVLIAGPLEQVVHTPESRERVANKFGDLLKSFTAQDRA